VGCDNSLGDVERRVRQAVRLGSGSLLSKTLRPTVPAVKIFLP
jgi:hypothetical protein